MTAILGPQAIRDPTLRDMIRASLSVASLNRGPLLSPQNPHLCLGDNRHCDETHTDRTSMSPALHQNHVSALAVQSWDHQGL